MARQPRNTVVNTNEETVGFVNIYACKGGQRTAKIAWQVVNEGDKLALFADKLTGVYTRSDGKTIEIEFNPVSDNLSADDLF